MLFKIDCKADIAAQDATYPTYKGMDCDLHINANDDGFHGRNIDCTLSIIRTLADACIAKTKSIRTRITINGVDVTAALKGDIAIQHNKNMISVFSLQLGDSQYSPLRNTNIALNKVVVITVTINGFEATMFTGLIDDINVDYSLDNFAVNISGSDYGKKLRDKKMTLVSIQDSAVSHYRGALVKYLASQAGVTNVNSPAGSYTRIDHSFNSQSILDMITKELTIDSYWWRFDENGILQIALDSIKTNTTTYPTADWTYEEDQITRLGLLCADADIINSIKVLGTVYETQLLVDDEDSGSDSPYNEYVYPKVLFTDYLSYSDGEQIYYDPASNYTKVFGDFTLKISARIWYSGGEVEIKIGNKYRNIYNDYVITSIDYTYNGITLIEMNEEYPAYGITDLYGIKFLFRRRDNPYTGDGFTFSVTVNGYNKSQMISEAPAQFDETSPTYDYHYDQVAVEVIDSNSIAKYGEKRGDTIEFPLAENADQCEGIGKKIIRDSHRLLKQPDFEVGLNPLLKVGQTIQITDKKTGHTENRWYVEGVVHTLGQGFGNTRVGCVYYA